MVKIKVEIRIEERRKYRIREEAFFEVKYISFFSVAEIKPKANMERSFISS